MVHVSQGCLTGGRLDAADAGSHGEFTVDEEHTDFCCVIQVRAAAELDRVSLTHVDNADNIAVLFAKKRCSALLAGLLNGSSSVTMG